MSTPDLFGTPLASRRRCHTMSATLLASEAVRELQVRSTDSSSDDWERSARHHHMATLAGGSVSDAVRVPGATYRFQFNHLFTFKDAQRLVPFRQLAA